MKLHEASLLTKHSLSHELFARVQQDKRYHGRTVRQEDISQFAADIDVEYNGLGKKDLKVAVWEGLEGMRSNPQLVENVFKEFHETWMSDYHDEDEETIEEAKDEAWGELVDEFFVFMLNKKSRFPRR